MDRLFQWWENLVEPYPPEEPETPPATFVAFCWHNSKGIWPWLLAMGVLGAAVAMLEIVLFSYLGNIVDWLSSPAHRSGEGSDANSNLDALLLARCAPRLLGDG